MMFKRRFLSCSEHQDQVGSISCDECNSRVIHYSTQAPTIETDWPAWIEAELIRYTEWLNGLRAAPPPNGERR